MNSAVRPGCNWIFWLAYVGLFILVSFLLERLCPWQQFRPFISVGTMMFGGLLFVILLHGLPILTAVYMFNRRLPLAENNARLALAFHRLVAPGSREVALQLSLLAEVLRMQGRFADAEATIKEALSLLEGVADSQSAQAHEILGSILRDQGKNSLALENGRKAVTLMEELLAAYNGDESDRLKRALANASLELGRSLNSSSSSEAALEFLHRALTIRQELGGGRWLADVYSELACSYLALGELKEAECAAQSALAQFQDKNVGAEDALSLARAQAAAFRVVLQSPERSREERAGAEAMMEEARAVRKSLLLPGDPELRY